MLMNKRKKAIMGIGTLIIFIATILVAAVAAGVLISTSGVLQQRALITGQEARKKITNAIEVVSIVAYGNQSDESLNNFETLVRLDAGSDPTQMKKFDLSFIGPTQHAGAQLAHPSLLDTRNDPDTFFYNVTGTNGFLLDNTRYQINDLDEDGGNEHIYLYTPTNTSKDSALIINFSDEDSGVFYYDLGLNMDNINSTNYEKFKDIDHIIYGNDSEFYGYIHLKFNTTTNGSINVSMPGAYIMLSKYFTGDCEFDVLPPEDYYCFEVMHGDDDEVLGDGEVFMLKFKLEQDNRMFIGEEFEFIFSSEKGRLTRAQAKTPDIIQTHRVPLWPVG